MKLPIASLFFAACAALVALPSCIIHVDAAGVDSGFMWDDDDHGAVRRGSGTAATESRSVADFHAVTLRGAASVRVRLGAESKLDVTCDDNLLRYVRTEVRDGALVIEMEHGRYSFRQGLNVDIVTPSLDALMVSGSGDIELTDIAGPRLSIGVSGSGDIRATGSVDVLEATVSGSGELDLSKLVAKAARAQISGSGDIELQVTEQLDATISGSGDVRYSGAARVNPQITGSGSISRR